MFEDLELSPLALLLAVVFGIFAFWMAARMTPSFIWRIITAVTITIGSYVWFSRAESM